MNVIRFVARMEKLGRHGLWCVALFVQLRSEEHEGRPEMESGSESIVIPAALAIGESYSPQCLAEIVLDSIVVP